MTHIPYALSILLTLAGLGFLLAGAEWVQTATSDAVAASGGWLLAWGFALTLAGVAALAARTGR